MAKINKLPKHMADLIAAGEVVERPASVVKELMENAVDAGATSITVEIQHGGISYIRVTDDGCGIEREDVKTAFVSHATSKIKTAEDLNTILTLGFRGEALPSIAAVSKVNMITKTADEEMGTTLLIEGGIITDVSDAGCAVGTTMIVRELFYNTPARMKFLKKDVSEGNFVAAAVEKLALSHPEISIRFIRDGKQVFTTNGDGNLQNVCFSAFGKDFANPTNIKCDGNGLTTYENNDGTGGVHFNIAETNNWNTYTLSFNSGENNYVAIAWHIIYSRAEVMLDNVSLERETVDFNYDFVIFEFNQW